MGILEERKQRIEAAVALESVERTPIIAGNSACNASFCNVKLADYVSDMELNVTCNIKGFEMCGDMEGSQIRTVSPEILPSMWLSRIKVPGRELFDNELWQVCEAELVKQEDYDIILEEGVESWLQRFMVEKLDNCMERMKPVMAYGAEARRRFDEAGIPCVKDAVLLGPFEMFCGGRSMYNFLVDDLLEIPEKVEEVFDTVQKYNVARYEKMFTSEKKPYGVWIGGWRGTPGMISRDLFMQFSWKYFRELVDLCLNYDVMPILHLDACWDQALDVFKDIPKGKCIMALDGQTNMKLAKETVGDSMCIMGDVPASLLAFGKPEEVHDYVTNLIKTMGPTGFIISSGCDVPFNAKLENVQMITKARDDFHKR